MYDIDPDARLVYKYLRAYKSGRINALFVPGTIMLMCTSTINFVLLLSCNAGLN